MRPNTVSNIVRIRTNVRCITLLGHFLARHTYHDLDKDGYGETLEVREYDPDGNEIFYSLKCDADQDGHYEVAIKDSCIEGLAIQ